MTVHLPLEEVLAKLEVVLVARLGELQVRNILNIVFHTEEDSEGGRSGGLWRNNITTCNDNTDSMFHWCLDLEAYHCGPVAWGILSQFAIQVKEYLMAVCADGGVTISDMYTKV